MALQPEFLPTLLAAASMVGLAGLLLFLDLDRRLHRVFALFLALRALFLGLLAFSEVAVDLPGRLRVYAILAVPFAALYFAAVYLRRPREGRAALPTRGIGWGLLATALLLEGLYAWRHDFFISGPSFQPLALFVPLSYATFALIAWLLARDGAGSSPGPDRQGLLLVGLAFCLEPLYLATFRFLSIPAGLWSGAVKLSTYGRPVILAELGVWAAALALCVLAAAKLLRGAAATELRRARRALPAPVATALLSAAVLASPGARDLFLPLHFAFQAAWSLAVPVLVFYALVRHRVFDLDMRLRWTISRGSVAFTILGVFFIAAQLSQNFLSERLGWFAGGIAAGLLLFAITPLQQLGERMARAAVPRTTPVGDLTPSQREALYLEQVSLAWTDGSLTRKQRLLLDGLRDRLGLSLEAAHRIESAAARDS